MKTPKTINWPLVIIVATVFVSATRWIPALMRSEGFEIPEAWLSWWVPVSALLAVGQPIVEAVSIAFALNAYRYMKNDSQKNLMMVLIGGTLVSFVGVLTPNIVSSGSGRSMYSLLGDWMWAWGISVVLSTVMPVAAVAFGAARMSETVQKGVMSVRDKDGGRQEDGPAVQATASQLPRLQPTRRDTSPDNRIEVDGYEGFLEYISGMNGNAPRRGSEIEKMFKVSHNTAYQWARKMSAKSSAK